MTDLTRAALAQELGLTPARISQLLTAGTLEGCYRGDGRQRRYDLEKVRIAYLNRTDPGQMLGNGAATVARIEAGDIGEIGELDALSPDTSAVAIATRSKAISAREQARRDMRRSAEEEGRYVLAREVDREVAGQISRLAGEVDSIVIRDGARAIADELGADYGKARQILRRIWRDHRRRASAKASSQSQEAALSVEEKEADI